MANTYDDPYREIRRSRAQQQAEEENKNIGDFFGGIGNYIGDAGKNIGNFFADLDRQAGEGLQKKEANREKRATFVPFGGIGRPNPQAEVNSRDVAKRLSSPAEALTGHIVPTEKTDIEKLMDLLNEKYNRSPVGSDSAAFEEILNQKLGAINGAREQAQGNFNKSDAAVAAMHDAFKNEILGRAPQLQEQNKQFQGNVASIFDTALNDNDARAAQNKKTDEEMYQRLGIAPAAAAPDLVGQAIAEGDNRLQGSKTSRLNEAAAYGQTDLSRNTNAANAVGNEGLGRRSELQGRLQEILGDLGNAETEARTNFLGQSSDAAKEQEQRQYERFLKDRDFNMDRYGMMNDSNMEQIKAQEKASSQGGGIDELMATTNPAVVQGIQDIAATEKDVDLNNFADVAYRLRKKGVKIDPTEVQVFLTKWKNLSKTNNVVPNE